MKMVVEMKQKVDNNGRKEGVQSKGRERESGEGGKM